MTSVDETAMLTEEAELSRDTERSMKYDEYLVMVEELGFQLAYSEPVGEEVWQMYWRDGVLLVCDSFRGVINSAEIYFNAHFPVSERVWGQRFSGRLHTDSLDTDNRYVWVGSMNVVESLQGKMLHVQEDATFLPVWLEQPTMSLMNQEERRAGFKYGEVVENKIALLSPEIRSAILG